MKRQPKLATQESFGQRLARYRKARGLTQAELAEKIDASQRMIAYYEGETKFPPAHLLPLIAKTLHVSLDELFGLKNQPLPEDINTKSRAWQQLKHFPELEPQKQKAVLNMLRAFLKKAS